MAETTEAPSMKREQGNISVHTEKLFPIIKKWLYSERNIFLRELISNGYDAIYKLERLHDIGEYKQAPPPGKVELKLDAKARTLSISDNGLGMTAEEVKKYINQIAFSGAEDFLAKYETAAAADNADDKAKSQANKAHEIIGHFGLGFFSAFMVAKRVELYTRSYTTTQAGDAVHWSCNDGSTEFTLEAAERAEVGTDIILHIADDCKEYLNEAKIKELAVQFSDFLPIVIAVNGKQVNQQNPLWQRPQAELKEEDYLKFYEHVFPGNEPPLFYVHLSIDFPFQVKSILYFPKLRMDMDVTKTGRLKLFCNNVFVSDNIVDIVPQYLNMLQGVLDSKDLPLNVSRSALQNDARVKKLAAHIVKKLADKLVSLMKNQRENYEGYWRDIHTFVKFGVINDVDFYEKVKSALLFNSLGGADAARAETNAKATEASLVKQTKTTAADEQHPLITLEAYKQRNPQLKDTVLYAANAENEHRYIADVQKLGAEVLLLDSPLDAHFMQFLETKLAPMRFARVDSAPAEELVAGGDAKKEQVLDEAGEKAYMEFFKTTLGLELQELSLKTLADKQTPALFVVNEQLRRFQEMSSLMQTQRGLPEQSLLGMTLVLNRAHPLIAQTRGWLRKQPTKVVKSAKADNEHVKDAEKAPAAQADAQADKAADGQPVKAETRPAPAAAELIKVKPVLQNIYDLALLRSGKLKGAALDAFLQRATGALTQEVKL